MNWDNEGDTLCLPYDLTDAYTIKKPFFSFATELPENNMAILGNNPLAITGGLRTFHQKSQIHSLSWCQMALR